MMTPTRRAPYEFALERNRVRLPWCLFANALVDGTREISVEQRRLARGSRGAGDAPPSLLCGPSVWRARPAPVGMTVRSDRWPEPSYLVTRSESGAPAVMRIDPRDTSTTNPATSLGPRCEIAIAPSAKFPPKIGSEPACPHALPDVFHREREADLPRRRNAHRHTMARASAAQPWPAG
jgi:hypothetical protein